MSARAAARLLMIGLNGEGLSPRLGTVLKRGEVGGLILFREDMPTLEAAASLIAEARARCPHPLLVALDEEGGIVSQIEGVPRSGRATRGCAPPPPRARWETWTTSR